MQDTTKLTEKLTELHGIPANMARVIGVDRLLALCDLFGGTTIYIPKRERILRHLRDENIRCEFLEGHDYKRLALKYGLSERRIRQIVHRRRAEPTPKK